MKNSFPDGKKIPSKQAKPNETRAIVQTLDKRLTHKFVSQVCVSKAKSSYILTTRLIFKLQMCNALELKICLIKIILWELKFFGYFLFFSSIIFVN